MARLKTDKDAPAPTAEVVDPTKFKVVSERWWVEEFLPARVDPAGNGAVLPEQWVRNYEPFETEKDANSWIAKHSPDYEEGKFHKVHEELREVKTYQWFEV